MTHFERLLQGSQHNDCSLLLEDRRSWEQEGRKENRKYSPIHNFLQRRTQQSMTMQLLQLQMSLRIPQSFFHHCLMSWHLFPLYCHCHYEIYRWSDTTKVQMQWVKGPKSAICESLNVSFAFVSWALYGSQEDQLLNFIAKHVSYIKYIHGHNGKWHSISSRKLCIINSDISSLFPRYTSPFKAIYECKDCQLLLMCSPMTMSN